MEPFSEQNILLSNVHSLLNLKVSLALVNFFIHNSAKLYVIDTTKPFNNFLLKKNLFPVIIPNKFSNCWSQLTVGFWFPNSVYSINNILCNFYLHLSGKDLQRQYICIFIFSGISCISNVFKSYLAHFSVQAWKI